MASEISWRAETTGGTYYATIRSSARTMWNGSALEALTVANWGNYDIALAETPASSYFYVGDWPAALTTVGFYWVDVYLQAGASPAISDTLKGTIVGYWNGTTLDPWDCDAVQVGGTTQTGGDIVSLIGNIANVGSPSYAAPSNITKTTFGTETNTYANVDTRNSVYHSFTDSGGTLSITYHFTLDADEVASSLIWAGRWIGSNDTLTLELYDWTTSAWSTVASRAGVNTDTPASDYVLPASPAIVNKYTSTAANGGGTAGKVDLRISGTGLSTCTLRTDQCVVGKTTRAGGIENGSTLTLAGSNTNKNYVGENWVLVLNGQDISGTYASGAKQVTGVSSGTTAITFEDMTIGSGSAGATLPPGKYLRCTFNTPSGQPFTAASAGQYLFIDCVSGVAGSGTPYFNFAGTGGTTGVNFRRWSGGSNITLDSNCTLTMEVVTGGGQTIATAGANAEIRGVCRAVSVTLGTSTSETVQIAAVTGPVTITGSPTAATVNVYGVTDTVTPTLAGATINNKSVSQATINAQVDDALNTAIPSSPTADSINERIKTMDTSGVTLADTVHGGTNASITLGNGIYLGGILDGSPLTIINDSSQASIVVVNNGSGKTLDTTGGILIDDLVITAAPTVAGAQAWFLTNEDADETRVARTGADSDTLETLSDQLDALAGTSTGAYACTWTVNDGAAALQGATVSFWLNGVLKGTGTTGVAGTVGMSLDAATYTVAITLDGYVFANTTHAVSSTGTTWTKTFSMTQVAAVPSSTDPAKTTAYWYAYSNAGALVGSGDVTMTIEIVDAPSDNGVAYDDTPLSVSSNASGLISATLFKGGRYKVTLSDGREWTVSVPLSAGSTYKMQPIRVVAT